MIKCLSKAKDKVKNFVVENSVAFRRASIGAGATALVVGSSLVSFATDGATGGSAAATATTILQDSVKILVVKLLHSSVMLLHLALLFSVLFLQCLLALNLFVSL